MKKENSKKWHKPKIEKLGFNMPRKCNPVIPQSALCRPSRPQESVPCVRKPTNLS